MRDDEARFEIVKSTGAEEASVELWDRALEPGGLAFEAVATDDGSVTVTGYRLPVPFATLQRFLLEASSYLDPPNTGASQRSASDVSKSASGYALRRSRHIGFSS